MSVVSWTASGVERLRILVLLLESKERPSSWLTSARASWPKWHQVQKDTFFLVLVEVQSSRLISPCGSKQVIGILFVCYYAHLSSFVPGRCSTLMTPCAWPDTKAELLVDKSWAFKLLVTNTHPFQTIFPSLLVTRSSDPIPIKCLLDQDLKVVDPFRPLCLAVLYLHPWELRRGQNWGKPNIQKIRELGTVVVHLFLAFHMPLHHYICIMI